ncbi:MAG: bifunctional phosphoglucose/phosphomannose isomerase [Candidatus Saccharimonadales bacterium]
MLDDSNVLKQRDPQNALGVAATEPDQLKNVAEVVNTPGGKKVITSVVITGMGGSALAAGLAKNWLDMAVPFEIVRRYQLPAYVNATTLVIASSYSGNTEETLSAYQEAMAKGAHVAVLASGGKLLDAAKENSQPYVELDSKGIQPRMAVLANLKALVHLLESYKLVEGKSAELEGTVKWLKDELKSWLPSVPEKENYAKQLAQELPGKTPIVYAGSIMGALGYKWKIGFNENAKNVSFANELPEFNHNEFIGWSSHPTEKPYAVLDLVSSFEHPQVLKRFAITDRLLSGMRPKATRIELHGNTALEQMLWGAILGDFVSIYLAILNGVNPTPVDLVEKFKAELNK